MTKAEKVLSVIYQYGSIDGDHHKQWVLDQIVRILTDCKTETVINIGRNGLEEEYEILGESDKYREWVKEFEKGDLGPDTYKWNTGIAP